MICTTTFVVRSGLLTRQNSPADKRKVVSYNTFLVFLLYFHSFVNIFPSSTSVVSYLNNQLQQFYTQIVHRAKYLYQYRTLGPFICPNNQAEYYQEVPHD